MKKIISYCFEKWWAMPLIFAALIVLSFEFERTWILITGILLVTISIVYQFVKKGWKIGCLSGFTILVIIALSTDLLIFHLFPSPDKTHRKYSRRYERRSEIQKIIGVEIPKFKIVDSRLTSFNESDFEFEVLTTIEFKKLPDDNIYSLLDSIILVPIPEEPDEKSSFFYYSLEKIQRCWSKKENKYYYKRHTDFGEKLLHSTDAFFYFEIERGSNTAEIVYGNN